MYKTFLKYTLYIFINLFAFLTIWVILDAVFLTWHKFLFWSIIFSIIPLTIIMVLQVKKITKELNDINKK